MDTERRRSDDKNWEEINRFMSESRTYRSSDEISQKYQIENIESLKNEVKKQNGRVFELEKFREELKANIQYRKEAIQDKQKANLNTQALITVIATIIMAVSAIVMLFKHG